MTLEIATAEEILGNAGLYNEMIKIMKAVDGKAPMGACCGKNKTQNIVKFIQNKSKYMTKAEEIKNRKIQPKWKGTIYIAKLKSHYSAETITDAQSKVLINSGFLSPVEKYFIVPEEEKKVETPVEETPVVEEKKETTKKRKTKKTTK